MVGDTHKHPMKSMRMPNLFPSSVDYIKISKGYNHTKSLDVEACFAHEGAVQVSSLACICINWFSYLKKVLYLEKFST